MSVQNRSPARRRKYIQVRHRRIHVSTLKAYYLRYVKPTDRILLKDQSLLALQFIVHRSNPGEQRDLRAPWVEKRASAAAGISRDLIFIEG